MVLGLISTKTNLAPLRAKAFAEETKVNEGRITSSLDFISIVNAANSRAEVQLVVSRMSVQPVIFDNSFSHFFANFPGDEKTFPPITSFK